MLPSDIRDLKTGGIGQFTADGRFPDYVRRLFDLQQMDFEAAFDQLMSILSWEPQKVYVVVDLTRSAGCCFHRFDFDFLLIDVDILPSTIESVSVLFATFPYFESEMRDVDGYRNEKSVGPR